MCIISFCMNIQNGHDLLSEKYLKSIWCHKWASAVGVFLIECMCASRDSVYFCLISNDFVWKTFPYHTSSMFALEGSVSKLKVLCRGFFSKKWVQFTYLMSERGFFWSTLHLSSSFLFLACSKWPVYNPF